MTQLIEIVIILGILVAQGWVWLDTRGRISRFRELIPEGSVFSLRRYRILRQDLEQLSTAEVLKQIESLSQRTHVNDLQLEELTRREDQLVVLLSKDLHEVMRAEAEAELQQIRQDLWNFKTMNPGRETLELPLIVSTDKTEGIGKILESINTYLIRNRTSLADFNLLRDITERNLDAEEEGINLTMPIPLYLGLMGTMAGIVIGLFAMPAVGSASFLQGEGVNNLIGGVKIAMLASLAGLLLTVLNSWTFRNAKATLESRKQVFFSFLQTELLPILSEGVNAGIFATLNRSIQDFSTTFRDNVQELSGMVDKNHASLMAQQKALDTLQKVDLNRVASFNIQVLSQLDSSLDSLEKFGYYLNQLNGLVDNTQKIVERTQNVEDISVQISKSLQQSQDLYLYLTSHFKQLDQHGQAFNNKVGQYDDLIDQSLRALDRTIHDQLKSIEDIKIREINATDQYFTQNRDKLSKLDYLELLERNAELYQKENAQRQEQIRQQLEALGRQQGQTLQLIERMVKRMEKGAWSRMFSTKS
ncbi:hypothetical protein [Siphonobacter sp.]|uniref:hypothetical protein n=1 Tax=Siphonobacter sp. TaxID=1869184 RepID=UPI003B3B27F0